MPTTVKETRTFHHRGYNVDVVHYENHDKDGELVEHWLMATFEYHVLVPRDFAPIVKRKLADKLPLMLNENPDKPLHRRTRDCYPAWKTSFLGWRDHVDYLIASCELEDKS